jgi:integrase
VCSAWLWTTGTCPKSPRAARSVKAPAAENKRVVPWMAEWVFAVRAALPERYQATVDLGAGCGLRQGEILGTAVDAIDFEADTVHVVQ